jgi:hypothetical protein
LGWVRRDYLSLGSTVLLRQRFLQPTFNAITMSDTEAVQRCATATYSQYLRKELNTCSAQQIHSSDRWVRRCVAATRQFVWVTDFSTS